MARQKPLAQLSPAYRKRLESHIRRGTLTEGAPRAVARGHRHESLERLRRRVRAHMRVNLAAAGTKAPVGLTQIDKSVAGMSEPMLRAVLKLDGTALKAGAGLGSKTQDGGWEVSQSDWDDFWDGEPPDDEPPEDNPLWYHGE